MKILIALSLACLLSGCGAFDRVLQANIAAGNPRAYAFAKLVDHPIENEEDYKPNPYWESSSRSDSTSRYSSSQRNSIKKDAYGVGIHADEFGRPVKLVPAY